MAATAASYPSVCLNMIVKNESRVILRLLESVVPLIDSYCICDTGSTDNTIEIITQFFDSKAIPGNLFREPFVDFGTTRTLALKKALEQRADYILLLDADMQIELGPQFTRNVWKSMLSQSSSDACLFYQGHRQTFVYKNVRLVRHHKDLFYSGVTHEYLSCPESFHFSVLDIEDIFIRDYADGGSRHDKFERDIALLTRGLEDDPENKRYMFYLANSYRDTQQHALAAATYQKRIDLGGWVEELWQSHHSAAKCYKALGNIPNALHHWWTAFSLLPSRAENLHELIQYYRLQGQFRLAFRIWQMMDVEQKHVTETARLEHLFLEKDVYDYKLDFEMIHLAHQFDFTVLQSRCARAICRLLNVEKWGSEIYTLLWQFHSIYALNVVDKEIDVPCLQSIGSTTSPFHILSSEERSRFIQSTPSLAWDPTRPGICWLCLPFVKNDRIVETGKTLCDGGGGRGGGGRRRDSFEIIHVLAEVNTATWTLLSERRLEYENTVLDGLLCKGLDDVRMFWDGTIWHVMGTRCLTTNVMKMEHGILDMATCTMQSNRVLWMRNGQHPSENNWVMYLDSNDKNRVICGWYPLKSGLLNGQELVIDLEYKTPNLFRWVRGSTPGVVRRNPVDNLDEIWMVVHVAYSANQDKRCYLHMMVVLDRAMGSLKRYSTPFTFHGKTTEYCLGLLYNSELDVFWLGFSVMDFKSGIVQISPDDLDFISVLI